MLTFLLFFIFAICLLSFVTYICYFKKNEIPHNIVVYSGSFDPLHIGHKAIIEEISEKYDWVYLIVTPQNPLKENMSSNIDDRIKNVQDAIIRHELINVSVSSIEKDMLPPYYTIRTLDQLKKECPHCNLTLVIGADNLEKIREWKDYERILSRYGVLVFSRGECDIEKLSEIKHNLLLENDKYKIDINETIIPNISSTEIRKGLEKGYNVNHLLM